MKPISRKLKMLRAIREWTQEDLAREIGVSLSTVQRWESKGGRPIFIIRKELARLFKKSGINKETLK